MKVILNNTQCNITFDSLCNLYKYVNLKSKSIIITDDNIPLEYIYAVSNQCANPFVYTIQAGEMSKCLNVYEHIIEYMIINHFDKQDLVIAIGGGVVGDLSGFVAATYKRGCRFINLPTSTLAMCDSSVGGKVAIDFNDIKNAIGTFYQPQEVLIDFNVLKSLPKRDYYNGLVEALKVGITCDKDIVDLFEEGIEENLENIIKKALQVKVNVVTVDEKEQNLRKVLNFGHTIGHGIESVTKILHGEAVALGILKIIDNNELKDRVRNILLKMNINVEMQYDIDMVCKYIVDDKKIKNNILTVVKSDNVGSFYFEDIDINDFIEGVKNGR